MLGDTYRLGRIGQLLRLGPELAGPFGEAFLAAEPDLRQWMPSTAREQENPTEFLERCRAAFDAGITFAYAMVVPEGEVAGYINLTPELDHAVAGYWVRPEWRGRGLAPLALGVLTDAALVGLPAAQRIHAHLDAANSASRRVLEKAGFRPSQSFNRPPRTASETNTEWLYVRDRNPADKTPERPSLRDLETSD